MVKRLLVLLTVVLVAGFVSQEATRVPLGTTPGAPASVSSRLGQVALRGVAIVLSPVGAMAGCGGGGGSTSATAVALADAVVQLGSTDVPRTVGQSSAGVASSLAVDDRRPVSDVAVSVRLSRATAGHTRVSLRHPDGTEILLYDADAAGLVATFDSASRPELHELAGKSPEGRWSLVTSSSGSDAVLETWSLSLRVRE